MILNGILLTWVMMMMTGMVLTDAAKKPTNKPSAPPTFAGDYCDEIQIEQCELLIDRDVVFVLDASDSMDPERFYNEALDFLLAINCAFGNANDNRLGLVIFKNKITVAKQLGPTSRQVWYEEIIKIRNNRNSCCACCTPTAEAIEEATNQLQKFGRPNVEQMIFVMSDGVPVQNTKNSKYSWPDTKIGPYNYDIVPKAASAAKKQGIRLFFLGVPNRSNLPPNNDYFLGIPDPTKAPASSPFTQCLQRRNDKSCGEITPEKFPLVSKPPELNLFSTDVWDVASLIDKVREAVCIILPTESPTNAPTTKAPTTKGPTRQPTLQPTTGKPTFQPTNEPSESPTQSPTLQPTTKSPTNKPTLKPTLSPTKSPTRKPTLSPSKSPTKRPTLNPTDSPTKKPTNQPTESPTLSPTKQPTLPDLNHLDLHIILDASASMLDYNSLCDQVIVDELDLQVITPSKCWRLFLLFSLRLADEVSKLGLFGPMMWRDDQQKDRRGLRVSVTGFACNSAQTVPVVHDLINLASNREAFVEGLNAAGALLPTGGTCPSEAIDLVGARIHGIDRFVRPYQAVVFLTDGIFFDMPKPTIAIETLKYFKVPSYAIGIAIPFGPNNKFGLSEEEIRTQNSQLRVISQGEVDHKFNLGIEGFDVLDELAVDLAQNLPKQVPRGELDEFDHWCGYTSRDACLYANGDQDICRFHPSKGICTGVDYCGEFLKAGCLKNKKICKWQGTRCGTLGISNNGPSVPITTPIYTTLFPTLPPSNSPTINPTSKPTKKPTNQPTVSQPTTKSPTLKPGATSPPTECFWSNEVSGNGGEFTPNDLCSEKVNLFGCASKNYCCYNFEFSVCEPPLTCPECPPRENEIACIEATSKCCQWNSGEARCERVCPGPKDSSCPSRR